MRYRPIRPLLFLALFALSLCSPSAFAQQPEAIITIADTTVYAGGRDNYLDIRISNFADSIAGVRVWIRSERPDLVRFDFSGQAFERSGTLLENWEYVEAIDTLQNGVTWMLVAVADFYPDGQRTPGFAPQSGGTLIRVPLVTPPNPDTTDALVSQITHEQVVELSTPRGLLVGVVTDTIIDTLFWRCTEWDLDSCLTWEEVDTTISPYDTMVVDTSLDGYIDSTVVVGTNGSVTLIPTRLCDINLDAGRDLSDVICLVNYLFFAQNHAGDCLYTGYCDATGDGETDLADLIMLVNHLFLGGEFPDAP
ncbi:hypothetical protein GF420_08440 [candidate division GN15 bacterium]|nr:hypothetical protein [candidate division GN15 bacterium]